MIQNKVVPVILSGGSGTRLWPLSRESYPKQFLTLTSELSLFQETLQRLHALPDAAPAIVVCNETHRFLIAEQARASGNTLGAILLEPVAKNTAPAVALAALKARQSGDDPILLVLPSDHVIEDHGSFAAAVEHAALLAHKGYLVTFGVPPSHPETGYGYIQAGDELNDGAMRVIRFVEKPNLATAQTYLDAGNCFWNSGMFVFKASAYLDELAAHCPAILQASGAAMSAALTDLDFCRPDADAFQACPADSVDYAVMEKTRRAAVVPLNASWSDVGAWPAVLQIGPHDAAGNAIRGDVLIQDVQNSYVYADSKLVCLIGVKNTTVIETPDVVLVMNNERAQDVKKLVDQLKTRQRPEATLHRQVHRPWGHYDSVDEGPQFKVKRITVNPGQRLSVQMHHHRAEHWVVVSGTAKVRLGDTEKMVNQNESIFIPLGSVHCLENPGTSPLELIEVQTGDYLSEDDIVRLEDRYGRS